jgi:hypothetical protein
LARDGRRRPAVSAFLTLDRRLTVRGSCHRRGGRARARRAKTRALYAVLGWIVPLIHWLAPDSITNTERVGRAMLNVARRGYPKPILESADIDRAAAL